MRAAFTAACALLATACGGYADLPVQVREQAELQIEAVSLFPGAVGTIQVALVAPEDVDGPLWLVGTPDAIASNVDVTVVGWAYGGCGGASDESPPDGVLQLCIALHTPGAVKPEGLLVGAVVDARAQARRFTVIGEVSLP